MAFAPGLDAGGENPAREIFSASSWVKTDESRRVRRVDGFRTGPISAIASLVGLLAEPTDSGATFGTGSDEGPGGGATASEVELIFAAVGDRV